MGRVPTGTWKVPRVGPWEGHSSLQWSRGRRRISHSQLWRLGFGKVVSPSFCMEVSDPCC